MIIDESLRTSGSTFAVNRFNRYRGTVDWKHHCDYFGQEIVRAYHKDNGKPCALYACEIDHCVLLVGESLDTIRREVKEVVG